MTDLTTQTFRSPDPGLSFETFLRESHPDYLLRHGTRMPDLHEPQVPFYAVSDG